MTEEFESEYLQFTRAVPRVGTKTCVWIVESKSEHLLGRIHWWGPWRQYVFSPEVGTVFNRGCLNDIARFCKDFHGARA